MYYLGTKIEDRVDEKLRIAKNKTKSWEYGYNPVLDIVIISKDGTLGEIYDVYGIPIGLPQIPDKKEIINFDKPQKLQKWVREELPKGMNAENCWDAKFSEFVERQFKYRDEGIWIYLNGKPVYMTGTYWHFLQWFREGSDYPKLRIIQNELMIFWEACKADERCYGMQYVKNRRFGASALGNNEMLESGSIHENKILGMISKKGADAKKIFNRLVRAFKRYPPFFKPETDGTNTPKTELVFTEQTKKRKQGEIVEEGQGLDTSISWHNTEMNAMDGEEIFRSLLDESGKYPKEVPFDEYWQIVKTAHRLGSNIVGKSMVVSTVNAMKKGGAGFKKIWDDSNIANRNKNGQTKSGLYRIFIAAKYCLEGFFDEYGFSIVEDPKEPITNDLGKKVSIGADTFLKQEVESLKGDPEKEYEFKRQFPDTPADAFRDESSDCAFNVVHITEQIEHNEDELSDNGKGNDAIERGNLSWKNGIKDGEVIWTPDPINGRFWILNGCHPPADIRNKKIKRTKHGITSFAPANEHVGCIGVDPFNRSKTVDGRGSDGAMHLHTKDNPYFPNNTFIMEYLFRPKKVELFFEDVIMAMVYWGVPILPESANENFLRYLVERRYRWFILNDPNKKSWKELSQYEKDFGGVNPQGSKIRDNQFYAIHSYIEDSIGVARTTNNRPVGEMGNMPFNRTLTQWKDTDPDNRTRFDAYISSSLAIIGNRRVVKEEEPEKPLDINPFQTYDNTGYISKAI